LIFERTAGSHGWTQTLEPRLFALHVPYRNQDDLPLFDTQELTFGFAQLFRENTFTGADRQTDANQVALALTSRWLDEKGQERARAGIGQVHYFDPPRVVLPGAVARIGSGSAYVAEIGFSLSDDWSFNIAQQWDPEIDHSVLGSAGLQYRFENGSIANLAYRYRRNLLEQVDLSTAIPLNERWKLIARFNQSLRDDSILEAFAGFEYESCCFAVRMLGRRYVRNLEGELNNAIFFELELKGLARIGRDTEEFLQRAILGYR
jgi:LPS-assembly protein